ncbi:hypothetical protein RRG08_057432 [Elysia crispata]|uniref:Uncharacterized protein n=1 Tax=Elysia crispata TaxID=231223 RepID=A0AAE1D986_9GAST|nr:hypothetical protein RRG08_057432 [Elysia crispata]
MKVSLAVTFLAVSGAVYIVSASSTEKRFIVGDLKKAFDTVKDDVNKVVNQGVKDVNNAAATVKDKLQDVLNKVKQGVNGFVNQVNKDEYVVAETTFNGIQQIQGEVDFQDAIQALIPLIDSDITEAACQMTCENAASEVLGADAAAFANLACPPLCKAALAELKDAVAQG